MLQHYSNNARPPRSGKWIYFKSKLISTIHLCLLPTSQLWMSFCNLTTLIFTILSHVNKSLGFTRCPLPHLVCFQAVGRYVLGSWWPVNRGAVIHTILVTILQLVFLSDASTPRCYSFLLHTNINFCSSFLHAKNTQNIQDVHAFVYILSLFYLSK